MTIVSPVLEPMQIELYNDKWLQPHQAGIRSTSKIIKPPSNEVDTLTFDPHSPPSISSMATLRKETDTCPSGCDINTIVSHPRDMNKCHSSIVDSINKIFFISYTPTGTMMWWWYLVQVNLEASLSLCAEFATKGLYFCTFWKNIISTY